MLTLPLQNSATAINAPAQPMRHSHSLSTICAVFSMAGIIVADNLTDTTFLMMILGMAALSSLLPVRNINIAFGIAILALFSGGFASKIEQIRFDNQLLPQQIDGIFTATILRSEDQIGNRKRLFLVNLMSDDANHLSAISDPDDIIRAVVDFSRPVTVRIGDQISGNLRLYPLSGPLFPGWPNYQRSAWRDGIIATAYGRNLTIIATDNPSSRTFIDRIRHHSEQQIDSLLMKDEAVIAKALLFGKRDRSHEALFDDFRGAGLSHLLAISGLHMALFCFGIYLIIRVICVLTIMTRYPMAHHKWAAIGALLSGLFYLGLADAPVSAIRAYMMAVIVLIGIVIDRRTVSLRNLNIICCLIIFVYPTALYLPSFQLSFAATYGIIMFYEAVFRHLKPYLPKLVSAVILLAGTSMMAITATFPIIAYHFGHFTIWGVVSNLVAIPLTASLILPLAVLFLISLPFGGGWLIAPFFNFALSLLISFASFMASLPYAQLYVPAPEILILLAFIPLAALLYHLRGLLLKSIPLTLIAGCCFYWYLSPQPIGAILPTSRNLHIAIFDDTILIHSRSLSRFWQSSLHKLLGPPQQMTSVNCRKSCAFDIAGDRLVLANKDTELRTACRTPNHTIITQLAVPDNCQSHVMKLPNPRQNYAIYHNDLKDDITLTDKPAFYLKQRIFTKAPKAWHPISHNDG